MGLVKLVINMYLKVSALAIFFSRSIYSSIV